MYPGTLLLILLACACFTHPSHAWTRVPNPPDVNKVDFEDQTDVSCWLASAANMLSAAGYADAQDIYEELVAEYDTSDAQSTDVALKFYTEKHPGNPYTKVTLYDQAKYCTPDFIASELRRGQFVTLQLSPRPGQPGVGHAVTAWGDPGTDTAPNPA